MSLKIGIFGHGHLGKVHRKCIEEIDGLKLVGIYDPDPSATADLPNHLQVRDATELLQRAALIDIVSPTPTHAEIATLAMQMKKHVFIEKPVTATPAEAHELLAIQKEHNNIVQIGHVERFNPAFLAISDIPLDPRFLEVHRLANFNPRGTDVSVVLDLMIHDLDIILKLVDSEITSIRANGVAIVSPSADIVNARIEWANGCVANVTASRISLKNMRKMRIFQPNAYIALDFLERNAQIIRLIEEDDSTASTDNIMELETPTGTKKIAISMPESVQVNAIKLELEKFRDCILNNTQPAVSLREGIKALELAYEINKQVMQPS